MDANTKDVLMVLLAGIPGALAAFYSFRATQQASRLSVEQAQIKQKVEQVAIQTNGLTKALVKSEKIVSHAEGKAEGKAEEKAENGNKSHEKEGEG